MENVRIYKEIFLKSRASTLNFLLKIVLEFKCEDLYELSREVVPAQFSCNFGANQSKTKSAES